MHRKYFVICFHIILGERSSKKVWHSHCITNIFLSSRNAGLSFSRSQNPRPTILIGCVRASSDGSIPCLEVGMRSVLASMLSIQRSYAFSALHWREHLIHLHGPKMLRQPAPCHFKPAGAKLGAFVGRRRITSLLRFSFCMRSYNWSIGRWNVGFCNAMSSKKQQIILCHVVKEKHR